MNREELIAFRTDQILKEELKYDFPEFLKLIRRVHGLNRRTVCMDLEMAETRLFYLETGQFKRPPGNEEMVILGKYYGVSSSLLFQKVNKFIAEGKCKPKKYKKHEKVHCLSA